MSKYLGGKQASESLGVHQRTLYQWEKKGWIKTIRTKGGKRLYDVNSYLKDKKKEADDEKICICYVRVSSYGQKDDLERQIKFMKKKYPNHTIIKDISSGINLNRKGLNKIIDLAINGKIKEVVIAYKDRLARFGYTMIERIIEKYSNGKIIIINKKNDLLPQEELMEDVMDVMNVFVAKRNGMRKYT
jgi:putative resolvase